MTRVNLIDPRLLTDQHLFAEWREIKMVPASLRRSLKTRTASEIQSKIGSNFTLGRGHVTFFFDKMRFLQHRYNELSDELKFRKVSANFSRPIEDIFGGIPQEFFSKRWGPSFQEMLTSLERIKLRVYEKVEWYRYYGVRCTTEYLHTVYNSYDSHLNYYNNFYTRDHPLCVDTIVRIRSHLPVRVCLNISGNDVSELVNTFASTKWDIQPQSRNKMTFICTDDKMLGTILVLKGGTWVNM